MSGRLAAAASVGRVNRWIALCAVLSLVVLVGTPPASLAHGNRHDHEIIFFGDSLSDNGNAALAGSFTVPPFQGLVPDAPYFPSLVFSNGPPWVVDFARRLNAPDSAKAAFASPEGNNYAVGGARARPVDGTFDLPDQVSTFLSLPPGNPVGHRDWVVIEFGGNDIRDAIFEFRDAIFEFRDVLMAGGTEPMAFVSAAGILCQAVASIDENIELLYEAANARKFYVFNGADLGITPESTSLGSPEASALATQLSALFNQLLATGDTPLPGTNGSGICSVNMVSIQGLSALETSLEDSKIVRFDVFGFLNAVADKPKRYGLSNGTDACIILDTKPGERPFCPNPNENLFWDEIHPTAAMHRIIARHAFFELLKGTWTPKKSWGKYGFWGFKDQRWPAGDDFATKIKIKTHKESKPDKH